MQSLSFNTELDFTALGATKVPVTLRFGGEEARIKAYVDTFSSACIFKRLHAEMLGLNVESGVPLHFNGDRRGATRCQSARAQL